MSEETYVIPASKFDDSMLDEDSLEQTDIKINVSFYIHTSLLKMQDCLIKDNARDGFLQYQSMIRHLEILTKSSKIISTEYEEKLKVYLESQEHKDIKESDLKAMKLHEKKLLFILEDVLQNRTLTTKLRWGFDKHKTVDQLRGLT